MIFPQNIILINFVKILNFEEVINIKFLIIFLNFVEDVLV